jgi:putative membrane protein
VYFGVPLSNFLGWALVGWAIVGGFSSFSRFTEGARRPLLGAGLYYGVLAFNLAVTWWIGEPLLLALGLALHASLLMLFWFSRSSAGFAGATLGGGIGRGAKSPSEASS